MDTEKKKKRQKRRKIIGLIFGLICIAALALLPFILEGAKQEMSKASILSGRVETGAIEKTVSGAGTLTADEGTAVDLPDGVKVTRYLVSNGDIAAKGQQIAAVDKNSVLLAMSKVQEALDEIEEEMADCDGETLDAVISSNVRGTVAAVFAEAGDRVSEIMAKYGALATVTLSDGKQINITGIDGTVTAVNLREGGSVFVGAKCFNLEDTSSTGLYSVLLDEHRDYEKLMEKLAGMYVTGAMEAPCDGAVSGIDEAAAKELEKNVKTIHASAVSYVKYESEIQDVGTENITSYKATVVKSDGKLTVNFADGEVRDPFPIDPNSYKEGDIIGVNFQYDKETDTYERSVEFITHVDPSWFNGGSGVPGGGGSGTGSVFSGTGRTASAGSFSMAAGTAATAEVSRYPLTGSTLMTVTPQEKVSVTITVDEMDFLSVNAGDEALVTIDALPGRSFCGVVTERNTSAANSGGNSKYGAVITFDRQDNMLDGMNASVLITFSRNEGLLLIPAEAVSEENGKSVVYTGYDEKEKTLINPVAVTTGLSDGEKVEITSGLELGDEFYYEYFDTLEIEGILNGGGMNHAHPDN